MRRSFKILFLSWVLAICCFVKAFSQVAEQYNRFQYHKYKWKVLSVDAYRICFPVGYDSLASFASVQLPGIMAGVKKNMGSTVRETPNIILYPSADQLYESNIGLYEAGVQTFPTIYLKGNRMMVAFGGSYARFREQLSEAWVRMAWEEQFKSDLEEQALAKKALVPAWFKEGAIAWFAYDWRIEDEDALYRSLAGTTGWASLSTDQPRLAGQAFCYFLAQKYRPDAARQILFQLRSGKSLSRAVRLIAKRPLDTLTAQCYSFFFDRLPQQNAVTDSIGDILKIIHAGSRLINLQYSTDGKQLAYITERDHKRKVYITTTDRLQQQRKKGRATAVYTLPPWLSEHSADPYPLLHWSESEKKWYTVLPEQGWIQVKRYHAGGAYADRRKLYGVDGVSTLQTWSRDRWLFAAYRRAKSDIVLYDAGKLRFTPLTDDPEDNTDLVADRSQALLIYRSGYPADSLYHRDTATKAYGVYTKAISEDLKNTAKADETLWLKDAAYVNWRPQQMVEDGKLSLQQTIDGTTHNDTLMAKEAAPDLNSQAPAPWLRDYRKDKHVKDSIAALEQKWKKEEESSILGSVLKGNSSREQVQQQKDSLAIALAYSPKKVRPYILQLYSAYFSARINNDYYINRLQPYQNYLGTFKFPDVGAMVKGGFSDLFDNHHFNIGYRMPAGSEGSDFFFRYENTARKLDWHVLFFRKVESLQPDPQRDWKDEQDRPYPHQAKVKTHYYELGFHYPIRYDWSLDFTAAARRDRTVFLASDRYSLNYEALQTWWNIDNMTLSVNKLHPTIPFLYRGWEAKLLVDGMVATGKKATILYGSTFRFSWHQPLFRDINLVLSGNAGHSGGQSKILYDFGGIDNNIVPRTDTSVRFAQDAPYAFQSLVTPFRGYRQNSLYGSSYALLNIDLYIPLFSKLIPLRTSFSALNQLQLGLFTDIAATAGDRAALPPRPSHLQSFGCSARTMLAGYPIRFDLAWPQEGFSAKPVWYLAFTFK
ncbi:hypothetical protein [Chitinophaga sp. OAE865]|uniref:hypothetical protein n=1 Tax=Chitinophaga sp. OAE865 TaxID=2817898 RepID=UPI001AE26474